MRPGVTILILLQLLVLRPALADEFTEQLALVRQYYEAGDYAAAAEELQFALQALRARLSERYAAVFPGPPAGWQADDVATDQGVAFMGGGVMLSRTYRGPEGATIRAQLVADNPMVQGFAAMLANPALMAAQAGARRIRLGRDSAILIHDPSTQTGEITFVAGRAMLKLEGHKLDDPAVLEHMLRAFDLRKLRDLAG